MQCILQRNTCNENSCTQSHYIICLLCYMLEIICLLQENIYFNNILKSTVYIKDVFFERKDKCI